MLPPPPRYPAAAYGQPGQPLIETNNILTHPTGPEHQLVVGEGKLCSSSRTCSTHARVIAGTYVLRDALLLATPPPHPSEAPVHNNNPLATTLSPPTAGTKISVLVLAPRQQSYPQLFRLSTNNSTRSQIPASIQESPHEGQSQAGDTASHPPMTNGVGSLDGSNAPAFGESNPVLSLPNGKDLKDPLKRRKPKSNIVKSNSSFVSRVIPHEALAKRLQEHDPKGIYVFANVNRAMQWLDLSSPTKVGLPTLRHQKMCAFFLCLEFFHAFSDTWKIEMYGVGTEFDLVEPLVRVDQQLAKETTTRSLRIWKCIKVVQVVADGCKQTQKQALPRCFCSQLF